MVIVRWWWERVDEGPIEGLRVYKGGVHACIHVFVSGRGIGATLCKPNHWALNLWSGYKMTVGKGQWGFNQRDDGIENWSGCMGSCIREEGVDMHLTQNQAPGAWLLTGEANSTSHTLEGS